MDWLDTLDNPRIAANIREFCAENNRELPTNVADAFEMWLEWNGIIGYAGIIRRALFDLVTSHLVADLDAAAVDRLASQLEVTR